MQDNKQKTVTYVGAGIIVLLLVALLLTVGFNLKNKRNLTAEKINSEKQLFGKMEVARDLANLKEDYSVFEQKSNANNKLLDEAKSKLTENEKMTNMLLSENRSLRANKRELAELKKTKDELEKESSQLKSDYERFLAQSKDLQNSLSALETDRKDLAVNLEKAQLYNTDNFLVTATRGKKTEKIVVFASRAKKLNMAFEVPQNLTEALSFKIITPNGSLITPDDKELTWTFSQNQRNFTASLSAFTGEFEQSRQVVLNYAPKWKLAKGEYRIQIICNASNIGNCRVKLK
jgi:hypothetical protein